MNLNGNQVTRADYVQNQDTQAWLINNSINKNSFKINCFNKQIKLEHIFKTQTSFKTKFQQKLKTYFKNSVQVFKSNFNKFSKSNFNKNNTPLTQHDLLAYSRE